MDESCVMHSKCLKKANRSRKVALSLFTTFDFWFAAPEFCDTHNLHP